MPDYGTVAGYQAYHTARGRNVDDQDDDEIEAAKLVASEWIDARYLNQFGGWKVGQRAQVRQWPRTSAVDRDGFAIASDVPPVEIENATYEATYRQMIAPGSLSIDWTPNKYVRASVDGAVSVEYRQYTEWSDVQTRFVVIDEILAPILTGGYGASSLSGAATRV